MQMEATGDCPTVDELQSDYDACFPLPARTGPTRCVGPADAARLPEILAAAQPGEVLVFEDGTYDVTAPLVIRTENLTLRARNGGADAVKFDGGFAVDRIFSVEASGVTIADLLFQRTNEEPNEAAIVVASGMAPVRNTTIRGVTVIDARGWGVHLGRPSAQPVDGGVVACSRFVMTDDARTECEVHGGVIGLGAADWTVRDSSFDGLYCNNPATTRAILFNRGSRRITVERNRIKNSFIGIHFGVSETAPPFFRSWPDLPANCSEPDIYRGFYEGIVRNNTVFYEPPGVFDSGIALWAACDVWVVHNTVITTSSETFNSIEWRYPSTTDARIANNIINFGLRARNGAVALLEESNHTVDDSVRTFANRTGEDFHLVPGVTLPPAAVLPPGICDDDFDRQPRTDPRDVGADER